jgi:hypothetical protein
MALVPVPLHVTVNVFFAPASNASAAAPAIHHSITNQASTSQPNNCTRLQAGKSADMCTVQHIKPDEHRPLQLQSNKTAGFAAGTCIANQHLDKKASRHKPPEVHTGTSAVS